jgi:hypothetical protein
MVKYTSSILLVAAFVAAPVFAQSNWDEFDAYVPFPGVFLLLLTL